MGFSKGIESMKQFAELLLPWRHGAITAQMKSIAITCHMLDYDQARTQGGAMAPPIPNVAPKIFRVIKVLMRKPQKYFNANQRHFLRNLSHQPLVEPDQSTMVYQLSMINQTLCTWGSKNVIQGGK